MADNIEPTGSDEVSGISSPPGPETDASGAAREQGDADQLSPGTPAKKESASGHYRVYADGAVSGWMRHPKRPEVKYTIRITVDGKHSFETIANQPNFSNVPDSDGFNSFIFFLPQELRDGAEHGITAISDDGYALKNKESAFTLSEMPDPDLIIHEISGGAIKGRLAGITASPRFTIGLQDASGAVVSRLEPNWEKSAEDGTAFTIKATAFDPADILNGKLRLTYPGLAQELCEPVRQLSLSLQRRKAARLEVACGIKTDLPMPAHLTVTPLGSSASAVLEQDLELGSGSVAVPLAPPLDKTDLSVSLALGGQTVCEKLFPAPFTSFVKNSSFSAWEDGRLLDWSVSGSVAACRPSYFSFRQQQYRTLRQAGVTALMQVMAGAEKPATIRQDLRFAAVPQDAELIVIARASSKTAMTLTLKSGGTLYGEAALPIGREWSIIRRPWNWTKLPSPSTDGAIECSFSMAGQGAGFIELALISISPVHVAAEASAEQADGDGRNQIDNADLTEWTVPLKSEPVNGRIETARGWFLFNRKAPAPRFHVSPVDPSRFGAYALSFGADRVADYCRLEIAVKPEVVEQDQSYELSFNCSIPAVPHAVKLPPKAKRWVSIDRIALLSRGEEGDDRIEAHIAKRIFITQTAQDFTFRFDLPAGPDSETATRNYYIIAEIKEPFWLQIHSAALTPDGNRPKPARPNGIRLEDSNIIEQAEALKGIGHWVNAAVERSRIEPPRRDTEDTGIRRWNWSWKDMGSVEVAICVYNAADETLACLQSLVGASAVPHTVRIIDDGSQADTRNRIAAFIADKPWMSLDSNPRNLGYTQSANRGILESKADWVVLLNSDTIVSKGWLEGMLACAASDPAIAFVGPLSNAASYQSIPNLYDKAGKWATNDLPKGWTVDDMAAFVRENSRRGYPGVPLLNGFCTLIRRRVFADLGGLNEVAFPMGYGEENDLCLRAGKEGYKLAVADDCYVYHSKSASFGQARRAELAKAGDKAFRELHADVSIPEITRQFGETPELVHMRDVTRQLY